MTDEEMNTIKIELIKWICSVEDEAILNELEKIMKESE